MKYSRKVRVAFCYIIVIVCIAISAISTWQLFAAVLEPANVRVIPTFNNRVAISWDKQSYSDVTYVYRLQGNTGSLIADYTAGDPGPLTAIDTDSFSGARYLLVEYDRQADGNFVEVGRFGPYTPRATTYLSIVTKE